MIKEREREWHIRTKYPTIHIITNGDGGTTPAAEVTRDPAPTTRGSPPKDDETSGTPTAHGASTALTSLRPRLVQYSKTALPASDGIPPLDHVPRAAIAAPVLDPAHRRGGGRDGRRRGGGGGGGGGGAGGAPPAVGRRGVHVRFVYFACVCLYIGRMEERRCGK